MEKVIVRMFSINGIHQCPRSALIQFSFQRCYATNPGDILKKVKKLHPYRKIHPWTSRSAFTKSLVDGLIYNEGGLVAINKPYAISSKSSKEDSKPVTGVVHQVDYTLEDVLPELAKELGHESLTLVKSPEKFTSGIALLAANTKMENLVAKALERTQGMRIIPATYWAVTTRVPHEIHGEKRLAMRMKQGPDRGKKLPIIVDSWTNNERKRQEIKILNVQFRTISNSTENLSSLLEIKSSTKKWHALRLFAATVLYSPILGDNIYGSRSQNVLGTWMNVSPFVEAAQVPPKLDKDLLRFLKISPGKEEIIPAHLHLRELYLKMFLSKDQDLILTASPMPEFTWTCRQLQFKHELFKEEEVEDDFQTNDRDPVTWEAVA